MATPDVLLDIVKIVNAQRAAFEDVPSGTGLTDIGQVFYDSARGIDPQLTVEEFKVGIDDPV